MWFFNVEEKRNEAAARLVAVSEMVNQAVGDALSGILMVETVLQYRNWSLQQWNAMYTDLPSRQLKVIHELQYQLDTFPNYRIITVIHLNDFAS